MKEIYTKEVVDLVFDAIASYQHGEHARKQAEDPLNLAYSNRGEAWFAERELNTKRVLTPARKYVMEQVDKFLASRKEK